MPRNAVEEQVSLVLTGQAIQSLRESDFDTCSAVGEVIDNSIQAEATEVHLRVAETELPARGRRPAGAKRIVEIAFGDNGYGMDLATLHHCLQLGYSTRYNDRSGIGRFGVGMTLAAINQCRHIDVFSRMAGASKWIHTYVDLDEAAADPHIPKPQTATLPADCRHLVGQKSGTLVVWKTLDRHPQSAEEITHWIARTYRKFISSSLVKAGKVVKNPKPIIITVNNRPIEAFDPLYAVPNPEYPSGKGAELFEQIAFDMPVPEDAGDLMKTSRVVIQMSLTPQGWRPEGYGKSGRSPLARALRISDNEGFSVLRANREVFYDVMPHFDPPPHADGLDRWWSAEICFDPVLDSYFSVRNIKRGARFVKDLRERIQEQMSPTIHRFRDEIKQVWASNRQKDVHAGQDVTTSHTEAEKTVKAAAPPPGKAGREKTVEEKEKEIRDILQPLIDSEDTLAAWRAKIESQPTTIVDNEGSRWKGDTFLDVHPQGGRTIIEYNMAHRFFVFVYETIKRLESADPNSPGGSAVADARKLKIALDLLFMAYAQAGTQFDPNHEQRIGNTLEMLQTNWGTFLRQYVRTYEADKANE
jgi:hypothetical protein